MSLIDLISLLFVLTIGIFSGLFINNHFGFLYGILGLFIGFFLSILFLRGIYYLPDHFLNIKL